VSEGPFTWEWVVEHLIPKERQAKGPDRDGCDRIAAKLNQAFACEMRKNEDGPIVRTLIAAIPIITGEHPRPTAIAQRLARS
jgi:hypothetical protein